MQTKALTPTKKVLLAYLTASTGTLALYYLVTVSALWQVYEMTGSVAHVGLVSLCQFLPAFLLFPWVGQLADQCDKRQILIVSSTILLLLSVALGIFAGYATLPVSLIFIAVGVVSSIRSFEATALAAWLPEWAPKEELSRAIALSSCSKQVAKIAAPALSGILLLIQPSGVIVYAITGILALLTIAALIVLVPNSRRKHSLKSFSPSSAEVWQGLRYVTQNEILLGAILLDLVAGLLGGFTAVIPVFAKEILHTGAVGAGTLRSMVAIGSLIGSACLASVPLKQNLGRHLIQSVAALGMVTFALSNATTLLTAAVLVALFGALDSISVNIRQTLIQIATPNSLRGRVSATGQVAILISNQLGEFRAGMMGALIGVYPAIALGGLCTVVAASVWGTFFPRLIYLRSYEDANPAPLTQKARSATI